MYVSVHLVSEILYWTQDFDHAKSWLYSNNPGTTMLLPLKKNYSRYFTNYYLNYFFLISYLHKQAPFTMVSILHRPFIASSCIVLIYFMHMYVCMVGEYFCIFVCVEPYIWGCTGIYVCMVGKPGSNVEYLPPFLPFYELKYEFACQCG